MKELESEEAEDVEPFKYPLRNLFTFCLTVGLAAYVIMHFWP